MFRRRALFGQSNIRQKTKNCVIASTPSDWIMRDSNSKCWNPIVSSDGKTFSVDCYTYNQLSWYIPLRIKPDVSYCLCFKTVNNVTKKGNVGTNKIKSLGIFAYDSYRQSITVDIKSIDSKCLIFKLPKDEDVAEAYFYVNIIDGWNGLSNASVTELMVSEGESSIPFEPYLIK